MGGLGGDELFTMAYDVFEWDIDGCIHGQVNHVIFYRCLSFNLNDINWNGV